MGQRERKLRLPGNVEQVRSACDFVVEVAQEAGLNDDGVFQCQLSVEEIFTNIVEHGYEHNGANKYIDIVCEITDTSLIISLLDDAPPFNPLALSEPDPDTPLWDRGDGGWGVYFVKKYMDDVSYRLDNHRNRLILRKAIS